MSRLSQMFRLLAPLSCLVFSLMFSELTAELFNVSRLLYKISLMYSYLVGV